MQKKWKIILVIPMCLSILVACTNEEEKQKTDDKQIITENINGIQYEKIYEMDDQQIIAEINGKTLSLKEIKDTSFKQGFFSVIDQFIDKHLLMEAYQVSDEKVEKETENRKKALGENAENISINKDEIRYQLSYDKALRDLVTYTDKDLKNIYNQYYKGRDSRSFEELKSELEEQAYYVLGTQKIYELQQKLRKEAKIKIHEASVQKEYELRSGIQN